MVEAIFLAILRPRMPAVRESLRRIRARASSWPMSIIDTRPSSNSQLNSMMCGTLMNGYQNIYLG
ncbi:uncharacterized protein A1O5_01596 [Cladophialophora psammophila CBS 110553]|uniref:Uncharacterized protein n=1 Tax=Cladophialophora psammophila CBS 110553 TaxID=1182543 RepID=W9XC66_9EURO|nr:uncharacterized protein A1O5_01596 [Cladophialophora psammophila CBS 110553]EXJ74900.1 hypothetical protein A1O5_01596 [Cladophialophora psammophila CBS 110553]